MMAKTFSRRSMLASSAGAATISLAACAGVDRPGGSPRTAVPLPDAATIRRDYQRMVDFGPRLPGNANHIRYVASMAADFKQWGLELGPCEQFAYRHWSPRTFGLCVERDGALRPVPDVAYYVRSASTGPQGITAPLHYGGHFTVRDRHGPGAMDVDLNAIPAGSIVVMDGRLPQMTVRDLVNIEYLHGPSDERDAFLDKPYKRLWLTPAYELERLRDAGAAGVIIIMDVSSAMIRNNFSPHASGYKPPIPALFVGADTGETLREQARSGVRAKLTLDAQWIDSFCPQLTATLPGESDEIIILNTHSDGQNFIEENGCVALVQLARHFATLPAEERLRRTIVFAVWPGHMTGEMDECEGWIRAHPDLMHRAVAAFTLEHFGATEWEDVPGRGYVHTGLNEYMNFATTAGIMTDLVREGLQRHDLAQHGIEPAPGITTGAAFHSSGVPHIGTICGPNYLLGVVGNGHMDKLDAELAAKQTRMVAEIIKRVDRIPAAQLRASDPTLGAHPVEGTSSAVALSCSSI